jgi:glycosyltransferase involved in cell wall biosynthesis
MSKVAIIMNIIDRANITPAITESNIQRCGLTDIKLIFTDNGSKEKLVIKWAKERADVYIRNEENIGNPQALNNAIANHTEDCSFIVILGNDISMPDNWLLMAIQNIQKHPNSGLVGFAWFSSHQNLEKDRNHLIPSKRIFGSWIMSKKVIKTVGYFVEYSKYGLWDSDYNMRTEYAGFYNYYIPYNSIHLGEDVGHPTEYRKLKDKELHLAKEKFDIQIKAYNPNCFYVNKEQEIIPNTPKFTSVEPKVEAIKNHKTNFNDFDVFTLYKSPVDVKVTVALPCYNSLPVIVLAIKSLINQKDAPAWELIVCEEEHENMIGREGLKQYLNQLVESNCQSVVYIQPKAKVTLLYKWAVIGYWASGRAFVLQAADCYSDEYRLKEVDDYINNRNYGWIDYTKGFFYSFQHDKFIIYDKENRTNLNMSCNTDLVKMLFRQELPVINSGIDGYLLSKFLLVSPFMKIRHINELKRSIDTDGFNNISLKRINQYDKPINSFRELTADEKKTTKKIKKYLMPLQCVK